MFNFHKTAKLPSIAALLKDRDFDTLLRILNDPKRDNSKWFGDICYITGENCLHVVLKSRPPAELVSTMLQKLAEFGVEEPELSIDEIGRTPLHFAVGYSCHPEVIKVLASSPAGITSTRAQDCFGRLPLHVAMVPYDLIDKGSYCKISPTSTMKPSEFRGVLRKTIAILVAVCPGSVKVIDDKGMTPLEHAKPLEFDRKFQVWVQKVAKVGGAVFSEEQIAEQKAKVMAAVLGRSNSIRSVDEPIPFLRSKKKTSTVLTRQPKLGNVAGYDGESVWSLAASPS